MNGFPGSGRGRRRTAHRPDGAGAARRRQSSVWLLEQSPPSVRSVREAAAGLLPLRRAARRGWNLAFLAGTAAGALLCALLIGVDVCRLHPQRSPSSPPSASATSPGSSQLPLERKLAADGASPHLRRADAAGFSPLCGLPTRVGSVVGPHNRLGTPTPQRAGKRALGTPRSAPEDTG